MAGDQQKIYEFKIVLQDVVPSIWRKIQVPETYTFDDLSDAILASMGWAGGHLHDFRMRNPITGKRVVIGSKPNNQDFDCISDIWEGEAMIRDYFFPEKNKNKAVYIYDFGDGWMHDVQLLKIETADPNIQYPKCIAGKRACPPEDCGGTSNYMDLLELRERENLDEEEKERLEDYQMDEDFDPEEFDPENVNFWAMKMFKGEDGRCCVS